MYKIEDMRVKMKMNEKKEIRDRYRENVYLYIEKCIFVFVC